MDSRAAIGPRRAVCHSCRQSIPRVQGVIVQPEWTPTIVLFVILAAICGCSSEGADMKVGNLLCGILLAGILIAGSAAPGRAQLQVRLRPPNVTTHCSSVGSGGASVSTSCPAAAGLTNYLWKIDASCSSPASTVSGIVTVTGTQGGTLSYEFNELGGGAPELNDAFPPIQASATNTAIVVTVPAISSGGACVACAFCSQQ